MARNQAASLLNNSLRLIASRVVNHNPPFLLPDKPQTVLDFGFTIGLNL